MESKKAFTMVELIFVIVIIGILAVIAVPKLAATKDDTIDARDCKNTAICITDMLSDYTARRTADKSTSEACRQVESSPNNTISVTVTSTDITISGVPTICNNLNNTYKFGGTHISL